VKTTSVLLRSIGIKTCKSLAINSPPFEFQMHFKINRAKKCSISQAEIIAKNGFLAGYR
jgi:hypothetical protein